MNKKCLIVSGGCIDDSFAIQMIAGLNPDYVIGVDFGLQFLYRNHILPTHIVGDFDSISSDVIAYYRLQDDIFITELNPIKDATDTEYAVSLATTLGVSELWILGATGTRLDHVLANFQILKIALDAGIKAWIVDPCNRISLWEKEISLLHSDKFGTYFSLFPLGRDIEDLTIRGAKYPLEHARISCYESRCVSNEYEDGDVNIIFPRGHILLMETRDKDL